MKLVEKIKLHWKINWKISVMKFKSNGFILNIDSFVDELCEFEIEMND